MDLPHLAVARKLEMHDPGSRPKPGDRVPYVLINTGNAADKQCVKAEDPAYAVENELPLDLGYYMVRDSRPLVAFHDDVEAEVEPYEQRWSGLVKLQNLPHQAAPQSLSHIMYGASLMFSPHPRH